MKIPVNNISGYATIVVGLWMANGVRQVQGISLSDYLPALAFIIIGVKLILIQKHISKGP